MSMSLNFYGTISPSCLKAKICVRKDQDWGLAPPTPFSYLLLLLLLLLRHVSHVRLCAATF